MLAKNNREFVDEPPPPRVRNFEPRVKPLEIGSAYFSGEKYLRVEHPGSGVTDCTLVDVFGRRYNAAVIVPKEGSHHIEWSTLKESKSNLNPQKPARKPLQFNFHRKCVQGPSYAKAKWVTKTALPFGGIVQT